MLSSTLPLLRKNAIFAITASVLSVLASTTALASVLVSSTNVTATGGPANELDVRVDPTNAQNVVAVAKDYSLGASPDCPTFLPGVSSSGVYRVWDGVYRSTDGGSTWTLGLFPGYPGYTGPPSAADGYKCMTDPVVIFNASGTLDFAGVVYSPPPTTSVAPPAAIVFGSSTDLGQTWAVTSIVISGSVYELQEDIPELAIDPTNGDVYVTYAIATSGGDTPMIARSTNGGATWSQHPIAAPTTATFTQPVIDASGAIFVSMVGQCSDSSSQLYPTPADYAIAVSTQLCVIVAKSTNFGTTWVAHDVGFAAYGNPGSNNYRVYPIPTIAIDRSGSGNIVVTWPSYDLTNSKWHVYSAHSKTGFTTLGHTTFTPSEPLGSGFVTNDEMPRVAISPTSGDVGIVLYSDTGDYLTTGLVKARFVASTDGGTTWSAPLDLSPFGFDTSTMYHQDGSVFIGDYVGLDFGPTGTAVAAWADGRNARSDAYVATISV